MGSRAIFRRFAYLAAFWLLLTGVALGPQDASAANGRYALIIGNSNYSFAPLRNPANDASLMAATLRVLGFEVFEYKDINQREMKRAIVDFGRALERAGRDSVGLFYYAGHGVQVGGENYLIPVGSTIRDELDVDIEGVRASIVLAALERAGNALNMRHGAHRRHRKGRDQTEGLLNPENTGKGGGNPDRPTTVRTYMQGTDPQGAGRCRAAAAPARRPGRVPRIARYSGYWGVRQRFPTEFRRRRLAEENRAMVLVSPPSVSWSGFSANCSTRSGERYCANAPRTWRFSAASRA